MQAFQSDIFSCNYTSKIKEGSTVQIISLNSAHSVSETVAKLSSLLQQKGIKIFATINHAQAARENGLTLRDEVLLIFGDPKTGTLLMQEQPTIGIDLPLKLLVWEDANHTTQVTYENPIELGKLHGIHQHQNILQKMHELLANLTQQVCTKESNL